MERLNYSSKDYESLRQVLLNVKGNKLPAYTETSPNDLGILMIELFALLGDSFFYYMDRIANESFLGTCTERDSAIRAAELIGYTPATAEPAQVDVTFNLSSNPSGTTFPKGDQVATKGSMGEDPKIFYLADDLVLGVGVLSGTGTCYHGKSVEDVFVSDGSKDQAFVLNSYPVSKGSITVTINSMEWVEVLNLSDKDEDDEVYKTRVRDDDSVEIIFGDGINGKIPSDSQTVDITYCQGGGSGNKVKAHTLTRYLGSVANVESVDNATESTDGSDREALAAIKFNAPASLKSQNRCVTAKDYETEATGVPGVSQAKAYEYGGWVNVAIIPTGGGPPGATLKATVKAALDAKRMLGSRMDVVDPVYVPVDTTVEVTVMKGWVKADVKANVAKLIDQFLDCSQKDSDGIYFQSYGVDVHLSTSYKLIDSVPGVESSIISILRKSSEPGDIVADVSIAELEVRAKGIVTIIAVQGSSYAKYYDEVKRIERPNLM